MSLYIGLLYLQTSEAIWVYTLQCLIRPYNVLQILLIVIFYASCVYADIPCIICSSIRKVQ